MMPRALSVIVLAALVLASAACSSGGDAEPTATATPVSAASYQAPGPYSVGVTTLELVDPSRPLAANGEFAGGAERALTVEVWYPAASGGAEPEVRDAPLTRGRYPLIIFAHGFSASRAQSALYTRHLASHGYVVASPDFPGSNGGAQGGPRIRAVIDQPGDVSFVIDEMFRHSDEAGGMFAGAIDEERVAITGHSLGGLTTMMTVFGPLRDDRIDAAVAISPVGCFLPDGFGSGTAVPLMVIGGSEELIVGPISIHRAYEIADAPKYYVELGGGDHIKFADVNINDRDIGGSDIVSRIAGDNLIPDAIAIAEATGGNAGTCAAGGGAKGKEYISGDRQRELLRIFGALFFDGYLRESEGARALLQSDLSAVAPEAVVEFE
jgi:predicted dienelactone hydrolase